MWIVGTLILLIVGYGIFTFNRVVRAANMVEEAWSGIDVQLKMRYDLIPNLVISVQEYAEHEKEVFDKVARARSESMNIYAPGEKGPAENQLSAQIKSLFAVAEAYPDVKASQNFIRLQRELTEVEDQIQYARRYYNGAVRDYNILVQMFPNYLLASMMGYAKEDFFEIEFATERTAPEVDLQKKS